MKKLNKILDSSDDFDMTSMIDIVFLLLIYFMCQPIVIEADLAYKLPAPLQNPQEVKVDLEPFQLVIEQTISSNGSPKAEVTYKGEVLGTMVIPTPDFDPSNKNLKAHFVDLPNLEKRLRLFNEHALASNQKPVVQVNPQPVRSWDGQRLDPRGSYQQFTLAVLDACLKSGITNVSFSMLAD